MIVCFCVQGVLQNTFLMVIDLNCFGGFGYVALLWRYPCSCNDIFMEEFDEEKIHQVKKRMYELNCEFFSIYFIPFMAETLGFQQQFQFWVHYYRLSADDL